MIRLKKFVLSNPLPRAKDDAIETHIGLCIRNIALRCVVATLFSHRTLIQYEPNCKYWILYTEMRDVNSRMHSRTGLFETSRYSPIIIHHSFNLYTGRFLWYIETYKVTTIIDKKKWYNCRLKQREIHSTWIRRKWVKYNKHEWKVQIDEKRNEMERKRNIVWKL